MLITALQKFAKQDYFPKWLLRCDNYVNIENERIQKSISVSEINYRKMYSKLEKRMRELVYIIMKGKKTFDEASRGKSRLFKMKNYAEILSFMTVNISVPKPCRCLGRLFVCQQKGIGTCIKYGPTLIIHEDWLCAVQYYLCNEMHWS